MRLLGALGQRVALLLSIAALSSVAGAAPCQQGGLDTYTVVGFNCTIGDKTFSSFVGALVGVLPSLNGLEDITVTPGGDSVRPSFAFSGNFTANSLLSLMTFTVGYTGTAPASTPFYSTELSLTNASTAGVTGTITAAEAVCEGGSFTNPLAAILVCPAGIGVNLGLNAQITNGNLGSTIVLPFSDLVTTFSVVKTLTLTGNLFGSASVGSINNDMTAVPEPAMGFGAGVAGLGWALLRRRGRRQSV